MPELDSDPANVDLILRLDQLTSSRFRRSVFSSFLGKQKKKGIQRTRDLTVCCALHAPVQTGARPDLKLAWICLTEQDLSSRVALI